MPALLNRAYPLTTIGVSLWLEPDAESPEGDGVHLEVDIPDGARLQKDLPHDELGMPMDLAGIDRALADGTPFRLPPGLHEELRSALEPVPPDEPVWLDFRRPFGHLPAIPWERLLQPRLGVPLLRLPFSAFPTALPTEAPRVAVCAPWPGTAALREFLQVVVPAVPGARFDVFTRDPDARAAVPAGAAVTFHEPPPESGVTPQPTGLTGHPVQEADLENPWLRWMAREIAPASVDVVHLVCPARVSRNFGLLDFGPSPSGVESPTGLRLVSVGQLSACLTRLGAASLSLAAADPSRSRRGEAGLRILAHRMTGLLSGPVILQAPAAGHADELAAAYRFLYSPEPSPAPRAPTLTLACHPELVRSATGAAAEDDQGLAQELQSAYVKCTPDTDLVRQALRNGDESTAWVASSQRLLERWTSGLVGTEVDPAVSGQANRGVTDALGFISSVIEDSVRGTGGDR